MNKEQSIGKVSGKAMKRLMAMGSSNKGLSLIEVIVSVAILGIIAIPFANMFIVSINNNRESEKRLEAYEYANQKMEELKNTNLNPGSGQMERGEYTIQWHIGTPVSGSEEREEPGSIPGQIIEINDAASYEYVFRGDGSVDEIKNSVRADGKYVMDDERGLVFTASSALEGQKVGVTLSNYSGSEVKIFLKDQANQILDLTVLGGQVALIRNLASSAASNSGKTMAYYGIDITVHYNGKTLASIASYKAQYLETEAED